jgi:hypothetical protein
MTDQTYLDAIAFLVQRGETDAAVDIYRRARQAWQVNLGVRKRSARPSTRR